jgi:hypothetical protein
VYGGGGDEDNSQYIVLDENSPPNHNHDKHTVTCKVINFVSRACANDFLSFTQNFVYMYDGGNVFAVSSSNVSADEVWYINIIFKYSIQGMEGHLVRAEERAKQQHQQLMRQ